MAESRPRYLLQITDCHLMPESGQLFRGLDTEATLRAVVADAVATGIPFDHLILSGDLVHHGGPEAYRRLLRILEPLSGERHWIPGNHDEKAAMHFAAELPCGRERVACGNWRLLLLDSNDRPDGRGSGSLSPGELEWLASELRQNEGCPVLVVLHHNPVPTGSEWQDAIMLGNAEQFAALVAAHPQVRGILCGHLHQHQALHLNQAALWCAPSSGIQFKTGQNEFTLEDDPAAARPGYCIYQLDPSGEVSCRLRRVALD